MSVPCNPTLAASIAPPNGDGSPDDACVTVALAVTCISTGVRTSPDAGFVVAGRGMVGDRLEVDICGA